MQLFHRISSLAVLGAALSLAIPGSSLNWPHRLVYGQTAKVQSASGRITSIEGNTFSLKTATTRNGSTKSEGDGGQAVLTFTIDQDTDVDGKIAVGAEANVTYRQEDGNNIAVSVRVVKQPSSPQSSVL